jgi:hypothetical protein
VAVRKDVVILLGSLFDAAGCDLSELTNSCWTDEARHSSESDNNVVFPCGQGVWVDVMNEALRSARWAKIGRDDVWQMMGRNYVSLL